MAAISLKALSKTFEVRKSQKGFFASLRGLIRPDMRHIEAVSPLTFSVEQGEKVAFIGPNGAGKSTTIKMMTGILYPSRGEISVLGLTPWKNRYELGFQIGTVFGQRSQLWAHLPPRDTFDLLATIYEIDQISFKKRLKELSDIFELGTLLDTPVRQLSLGQRMRCELTASLLHKPKILFLDEPTIGLDLNAKLEVRTLLNRLAKEEGTTLFLTSHDTQDIEEVATRVLIIDKGALILDSSLEHMKKQHLKKKILTLTLEEETIDFKRPGIHILEERPHHITLEVDINLHAIEQVIHEALQKARVKDITIEDPSMEEIIRDLYAHQ